MKNIKEKIKDLTNKSCMEKIDELTKKTNEYFLFNNNSKFLGIADGKKWTKINRIKKIFNMIEDEGQIPCSSRYVRVSLANTDVVVFVNEENIPTYKLHSISPNNIDYMLEKITKLLKLKK